MSGTDAVLPITLARTLSRASVESWWGMAARRLRDSSFLALNFALFAACAPSTERGPTVVVPALSAASPHSPTPTATPEPAPADPFDQSTPANAVASFLRAFAEKRWDVPVRFVPDHEQEKDPITPERLRAAWDSGKGDDVAQKTQAIRRALDAKPFSREGSRAWLLYDGGTVELVQESGQWKIEDL